MAWGALVENIDVSADGTQISVTAQFFDAATPTVVIDTHTFTFAIAITLTAARNAIIAYGSDLRTRLATKVTKAQQFVGQTIDIP